MHLRRNRNNQELLFDPEIERTCRRNNSNRQREQNMAAHENNNIDNNQYNEENPTVANTQGNGQGVILVRDMQIPVISANPSCIRLSNAARNYEIKQLHLTQLPTFNGLFKEDALGFMREFISIVNTFPLSNITEDELRMRCFPYTLKGNAKNWLLHLTEGSLQTWQQVMDTFMRKYYSNQRTVELRKEIATFTQKDGEAFHEAWERFKDLQFQCPHHYFRDDVLTQTFYAGLNDYAQNMVDSACGGTIANKEILELMEIYETLALNSQQKSVRSRRATVNEITSSQSDLIASMNNLTQQFQAFMSQAPPPSEYEDVNYMGAYNNRQQKYDPYSNTYNSGWRDHPNLAWRNQNTTASTSNNVNYGQKSSGPPGVLNLQPFNPPAQQKNDRLEEVLTQFMSTQDQINRDTKNSIQNLERQVGQLAKELSDRGKGKLPSNTEVNHRESVLAITVRSGKEIAPIEKPAKDKEVKLNKDNDVDLDVTVSLNSEKNEDTSPSPSSVQPYVPPIPYPGRVRKSDEVMFQRFLDIFKKLEINIPFAEALAEMPAYTKFLKELISNKKKLEENALVTLTEECSAILLNKLPPKLKDPGSFVIPCHFGPSHVYKCLCDLGSSINLIPLSLFNRIGIGELKPTSVTLQLANRSICHPCGIVEDLLVKVGKLIIPADFLVMEMEYDQNMPIILGRPFMATSGALIDVPQGKLTLRVGDEKEVFSIFKAFEQPSCSELTCRVDLVDSPNPDILPKKIYDDSLKNCSALGLKENESDDKDVECQIRTDPNTKDIVQSEVIEFFDPGIIYPISDNSWVSSVQVVPKKGVMTVSTNNKKILRREFKIGQKVLLFNSHFFLGKCRSRWTGPFVVTKVHPYGAIEVEGRKKRPFIVNGQRLKHYMVENCVKHISTITFEA